MPPVENTLTVAEIKRRGMAAIEEHLRRGPVHIVKRNKPSAVILSEEEYQRLTSGRQAVSGYGPVQWLLDHGGRGKRDKDQIDAELERERDW
jgi:prevent-host-death family protein